MTVTHENSTKTITLEDCLRLYKDHGVYVTFDEGEHVTLGDEIHPLPMTFGGME